MRIMSGVEPEIKVAGLMAFLYPGMVETAGTIKHGLN